MNLEGSKPKSLDPMKPASRVSSRVQWVACLAFISLGLPDAVLGVAWPSIAQSLQQPIHHLGWMVSMGFSGYLLATIATGSTVKRLGVAPLLILSCGSMILVLLTYTVATSWPLLLGLALVSGLAGGSIDGAINAYASTRFSTRLLNWMHACWGIGASVGPLTMTAMIGEGYSWRIGYGLLSGLLLAVTLLLISTRHSWSDPPMSERLSELEGKTPSTVQASPKEVSEQHHGILQAIRNPRVRWLCLLYWMYTGIEASAGYLLFSFLSIERGYSVWVSGIATSSFWGALTIGRVLWGQVLNRTPRAPVLRTSAWLGVIATLLIAWRGSFGWDVAGACLLGFALAPMFPTWISMTPGYVGESMASSSIGLQIGFAAIGAATFPFLIGQLASRWSFEVLPIFLIVTMLGFLFIQELPLRICRTDLRREIGVV